MILWCGKVIGELRQGNLVHHGAELLKNARVSFDGTQPRDRGNDREAVTSGNLGPKFLIPFEFPTRPCSCEAVNESIGSTEPLAQHLANLLGEVAHEHDRLTGCRIRARAGEHCARQPAFPEQLL